MTTSSRLWQDKEVHLGGMKFHYLDWGTGVANQPAMVLLHGGGQDAHSWDEFSARIRNEYHVYALDQRGHGDSDWAAEPAGYGRENHFQDISGFVDALGLDKFVLIGLSMGGLNGIYFTARRPEKVRAFVIVDVGPQVGGERRENRQSFASIEEFDSFEAAVEEAHRFNPRRPIEQLRERLGFRLRQWPNGKWRPKQDMRRRVQETPEDAQRRQEEGWADLKRIACPTLLVRGAESPVLAPEVAGRMVETIADCELVTVADAGHTVPGDQPQAFYDAVAAWLTKKAISPATVTTR
jgi:pimeloyl-ACP methyl ester carboxylesterase